jgi:hypothetical protein
MITSPRRRSPSFPVTRHFDFNRLQNQSIVCAYEALIPVVSGHPKWPQDRAGDLQETTPRTGSLHTSATGA